jgi:hypothetical protein
LFASAAAIDFAAGVFTAIKAEPAFAIYNNLLVPQSTLQLQLPAASTLPVFLLLGVEFIIMINGEEYDQAKKVNSLSLIAVDAPEPEI